MAIADFIGEVFLLAGGYTRCVWGKRTIPNLLAKAGATRTALRKFFEKRKARTNTGPEAVDFIAVIFFEFLAIPLSSPV